MLQEIDKDRCTGCGACFKSCGLDVFRLNTTQVEVPPCQKACPLGVDIRSYVHLVQQGKVGQAAEVLMGRNPLPALTGRTCRRFCEKGCARKKVDDAVNINALEQFLGDWALGDLPKPSPVRHAGRIGVVGSGAAGLSCAYFLNRKGYAVTVFEREEKAGGLFRTDFPDLPSGVVNAQIRYLERMGIVFHCGTRVGDNLDVTVQDLRESGYKAFLLAPGAEKDGMKQTVPPFLSVANVTSDNLLEAAPISYATSSKDVFAAGNVLGSRRSVAHAMAEGREAAESIDRYINGWNQLEGRRNARPLVENLPGTGIDPVPRQDRRALHGGSAGGGKKGVGGLSFEQVMVEANRCMTCGSKAFAAYKDDCMTCYACEMACPEGAIVVHPFKETLPRTIPYPVEGVR